MKKLILTLIFAAMLSTPAFSAHAGPAQWSLAGVASWAQILTASGTVAPSATSTYTIGDFYAQYAAASATVTLYRLCATGTSSIWKPVGSSGGVSSLLELSDLPSVTGNGNKLLALGTDTASFYWTTVTTEIDPGLAAHVASSTDPHGASMSVSDIFITEFAIKSGGNILRRMWLNEAVEPYHVVIASYNPSFSEDTTFPVHAPASSTQSIGIVSGMDLPADFESWDGPASGVLIITTGEAFVQIADDSDPVLVGDWLLTSDTEPGRVMKASVSGDLPLSADEMQRRVGIALTDGAYDETDLGTFTYMILKGNR